MKPAGTRPYAARVASELSKNWVTIVVRSQRILVIDTSSERTAHVAELRDHVNEATTIREQTKLGLGFADISLGPAHFLPFQYDSVGKANASPTHAWSGSQVVLADRAPVCAARETRQCRADGVEIGLSSFTFSRSSGSARWRSLGMPFCGADRLFFEDAVIASFNF
jgi:hypothetical protein